MLCTQANWDREYSQFSTRILLVTKFAAKKTIFQNGYVNNIYYNATYHDLSFHSVGPVLSLICIITTCYLDKSAICLGFNEKTSAASVICG